MPGAHCRCTLLVHIAMMQCMIAVVPCRSQNADHDAQSNASNSNGSNLVTAAARIVTALSAAARIVTALSAAMTLAKIVIVTEGV